MKRRVCFFIQTNNPGVIEYVEFYKVDIQILEDLGYEVVPCFSFRKIPTEVDFYFIWWWTYAIFPILMAKMLRRKTVITGTFDLTTPIEGQGFYLRPFYQRFLLKMSAQLTDANIMVSKYEQEGMSKEITTGNVFFSPHVLDLGKFVNSDQKRRQRHILTISWMSKNNAERKCIPEIIEAAHLLKAQGQQVQFLIAGKIEEDGLFLKSRVKQLGLNNVVLFLGQISEEEKIKGLHECGIYLQPSIFEGFGLAIAEAMACGTPVITSKVGAVPEVTGDHCVYVDGKDPKQIADAVISVLQNYEDYLLVAREAQNHIKNNFSYERRLNDFRQIFETFRL